MTDSQFDSGSETTEEQINLIDYFLVLWKHKYLILIGSLIPAVLYGIFLSCLPQSYTTTYMYDQWDFDNKSYQIFIDWFHDQENIARITNELPGYSPGMVSFSAWPPFADVSKVGASQITQTLSLKAQILNMTIKHSSKDELLKTGLVVRDNVENIMPVYSMQRQLSQAITQYKNELATIEQDRFGFELDLEMNKNVLADLKEINVGSLDRPKGNITIQFDIGGKTEYLPLGHQLQAEESKIVKLQENIRVNEKKYDHSKKLLSINEKLFQELKEKTPASYSMKDFHAFSVDMAGSYEDEASVDYLNSYIKGIENMMSASAPVSDQPQMVAVPKGTVKKSAIVFVVGMIISAVASFLRESISITQRSTS